ncbi:hypothetical protein [Schleiferilactobacillus shenzhenensis]|uniref:Uncharacterized protein n=1 Tax=Schleiferilactobacillus shenzhenensis LY-73 TaxID=1231336 RepID=U4TPS1_9LACO|nr:hypothetical protein [Schleiferilactobacillus shenzhenensis]ERL63878.1 hypothetical protein L248_1819 [Schleiferilactobacillus shenzhenensis LY-73]
MSETRFTTQFNDHGALVKLTDNQDPHHMNWVVSPEYLASVDYHDNDKLFGEFSLETAGQQYASHDLTPEVTTNDGQTNVVYDLPTVTVAFTYRQKNGQLHWDVLLSNKEDDQTVVDQFALWASLAYIMFRNKDVHVNMEDSAAVFPSISRNFTKLAAVRRSNEGPHLGLFQTAGEVLSVGTYNEWTNRFFENVSPSLDGLLFHEIVLAGGYAPLQVPRHDWIYPHKPIRLAGGASAHWHFVLAPFAQANDFADTALSLGHPAVNYEPLAFVGRPVTFTVRLPQGAALQSLIVRHREESQLIDHNVTNDLQGGRLTFTPSGVGEHQLLITLADGRQDMVIFNVMTAIDDMIQKRIKWLTDHSYLGADGSPAYAFSPISNQGESLGKLSFILQANLLHPTADTQRQVQAVEASAVHYVRNKWFQDGDFTQPVDLYGNFYRDMDFEYIGHIYYLLSKYDDEMLQLHSAKEYLQWAAQVFELRVNPALHRTQRGKEEAQMLGVYFLYINDLLHDLQAKGLTDEYNVINACWQQAVSRVAKESPEYKAAITEHFYDNAGFGPATGALAASDSIEAAKRYAELLKANIGFSNDFRAQAPDRWWEALSYMIHALWGGIVAASALMAYDHLGDPALLEGAYRATAGVLYMYDANATTIDRPMAPGEAASTYSIAGPNMNRPDLSRNRFGQSVFAKDGGIFFRLFPNGDTGEDDWDMGEEMAAYLTGFGQKTYVYTDESGTLHVVNGQAKKVAADGYVITTFAPYIHEYLNVPAKQTLLSTDKKVFYSPTEGFSTL